MEYPVLLLYRYTESNCHVSVVVVSELKRIEIDTDSMGCRPADKQGYNNTRTTNMVPLIKSESGYGKI